MMRIIGCQLIKMIMFYFIHLIEILCIVQFIMVFVILSLYGLSYDENCYEKCGMRSRKE
jgi:hypothetical protein